MKKHTAPHALPNGVVIKKKYALLVSPATNARFSPSLTDQYCMDTAGLTSNENQGGPMDSEITTKKKRKWSLKRFLTRRKSTNLLKSAPFCMLKHAATQVNRISIKVHPSNERMQTTSGADGNLKEIKKDVITCDNLEDLVRNHFKKASDIFAMLPAGVDCFSRSALNVKDMMDHLEQKDGDNARQTDKMVSKLNKFRMEIDTFLELLESVQRCETTEKLRGLGDRYKRKIKTVKALRSIVNIASWIVYVVVCAGAVAFCFVIPHVVPIFTVATTLTAEMKNRLLPLVDRDIDDLEEMHGGITSITEGIPALLTEDEVTNLDNVKKHVAKLKNDVIYLNASAVGSECLHDNETVRAMEAAKKSLAEVIEDVSSSKNMVDNGRCTVEIIEKSKEKLFGVLHGLKKEEKKEKHSKRSGT